MWGRQRAGRRSWAPDRGSRRAPSGCRSPPRSAGWTPRLDAEHEKVIRIKFSDQYVSDKVGRQDRHRLIYLVNGRGLRSCWTHQRSAPFKTAGPTTQEESSLAFCCKLLQAAAIVATTGKFETALHKADSSTENHDEK